MLRAYNYCSSRYYAYYKARLIKVIDILIKDTILSLYILYKSKLALYNLRILAESSLIVIFIIKLNFKLRVIFNKDCSLINAY
jgi:hypothetical protein